MRGWNGTIRELPAYNLSLIRQTLRKRGGILIRNSLTEQANIEYDEIYDELQTMDPKQESDIVLKDTMLSQIAECVYHIPLLFSLRTPVQQYMRIVNTKSTLKPSSYSIHCICAMQPMKFCIKNGNHTQIVSLETGDIILFPRVESYGYGKGTIDCFNYFK